MGGEDREKGVGEDREGGLGWVDWVHSLIVFFCDNSKSVKARKLQFFGFSTHATVQ